MSNDDLSETELLLIAKQAGLTPEEIIMHPEHGMMFSLSGALKMAANAPDKRRGEDFARLLRAKFGEPDQHKGTE